MSLRSFYVILSLTCCLQQIVIASPPMNIRKLYESTSESRARKEELPFPQTDEDVLELEQLKLRPQETAPTTPTNADDIAEVDGEDAALQALQKQQVEVHKVKSPLVLGQPEEEEQMVIPYRPHHPAVVNLEPARQEETVFSTEKIPAKPFYGAARLTYGQNPVSDVKTESTSTTIPTSSPSTLFENDNSTAQFQSSTPMTTTSNSNPITIESETESSEESISAELEATKNGERRSMDIRSPKIAESVLKHPDGQYSSFDMAQYVFWTGDEAGVAKAVEEFIQEGLMSRENAIKFLRDIRLGIEYLQSSYANRIFPDNIKMGPRHMKAAPTPAPTIQSTTSKEKPFYDSESRPTFSSNVRKALEGIPSLLRLQELNNDRNKENSLDYDDMVGRMRLADFLYAEYSLEEVIYQLAKVMFSQSLTNGSEQAQRALQKLTGFLESEGEHGRISPALQKKILDVILAALSDTLADHPELLSAARVGLGNSFHHLPKHLLEPIKN